MLGLDRLLDVPLVGPRVARALLVHRSRAAARNSRLVPPERNSIGGPAPSQNVVSPDVVGANEVNEDFESDVPPDDGRDAMCCREDSGDVAGHGEWIDVSI